MNARYGEYEDCMAVVQGFLQEPSEPQVDTTMQRQIRVFGGWQSMKSLRQVDEVARSLPLFLLEA